MLLFDCWWILFYVVAVTQGESAEIDVQGSFVQAEGLEAVFECRHPGAISYSWKINGTLSSIFSSETFRRIQDSITVNRLKAPAIKMNNNTVVQCEAQVYKEPNDRTYFLSENASLLVQGHVMAVNNLLIKLSSSSIDLSWSAPFSLDLTAVEPNIQYCVNVYTVTGGEDILLDSKCNITTTSYTFPTSDPNQVLNFTVMPRSNVEGSLNGTTSEPVQGYLIFEPIKVLLTIDNVIISASYDHIVFRISFLKNVLETSPGKVPTNYIVEFLCDELVPRNCSTEKTITEDIVELTLTNDCALEKHQIYKIAVYSQNLVGYSKSDSVTISTHDVELMQVAYFEQINQIDISCSYLEGSMDHGYFVVALTFDALPDYRVVYRNELESTTNVSIPNAYNYSKIIVYDLKQTTGYPEERLAGSSTVITTPSFAASQGSISLHAVLHDVDVATSSERICITCLFFSLDLIGCVGVIHSHSAQLENLTLTILPVNGSAIKTCTASMTRGTYLVAVFGVLESGVEVVPAYVTDISVEEESAMPMSPEGNVLVVQVAVGVLTMTVLVITVVVIVILRNFIRRKRSYIIKELEQNQYDVPSLSRLQSGSTEQIVFSQEESTDLSLRESSLQEPAYDSPHLGANTRQGSYVYASIDIDAARDRCRPSEDLSLVQYSCIDIKFVPKIESDEPLPALPLKPEVVPLPLTAETVLSEIYPVAGKWEELGEALGIAEHHLDLFSMEAHEHLRLHDMIHYYFSCNRCSWENIVRSLQTIGEIEIADKIIRTGKCQVTGDLSASNREETPPPLPPKEPTNSKFSQPSSESESGNGDSVVVVDFFTGLSTIEQESESEPKRQLLIMEEGVLENLTYYQRVHRQVNNFCETEKEQPRHKWSSISYFSTMIISLGLYDKFDVPLRHKARAIRNLTCARQNNYNELVQTRMRELAQNQLDIMSVSTENNVSTENKMVSFPNPLSTRSL